MTSTPRLLGEIAARQGKTALECPYPTGYPRREWLAGYNAERERIRKAAGVRYASDER